MANLAPVNIGGTNYLIGGTKYMDGFTRLNDIGAALALQPEFDNVISYLYGTKYMLGALSTMMGAYGRESLDIGNEIGGSTNEIGKYGYDVRNRRLIWYVQGILDEPVFVVIPPTPNSWVNNNTFQITVDKQFMHKQDVVRFPSGINAYVVGQGVSNGGNQWTYTLRLMKKNAILNANMDAVKGAQIRIGTTAVGELSSEGYSNQFNPELRDQVMGMRRRSFKMSGHAATSCIYFHPYTEGKKKLNPADCVWFYKQEHEFMLQMARDAEYSYWYSDRTVGPDGTCWITDENGNPIYSGDGVFNQIIYGVRRQYTPGVPNSYEFYSSILNDALRNSPAESDKTVVCFTGMGGITQFNQDMRGFLLSSNITNTMDVFVEKAKSQFKNKSWAVGANFSEFVGLFGCRFILVHNWAFDSSTFAGNINPRTGFNQESHRMVFLDYSDFGGKPNVQMLRVKTNTGQNRGYIRNVTRGLIAPPGYESLPASSQEDAFVISVAQEDGIVVRQPYSSVDLVPAVAN